MNLFVKAPREPNDQVSEMIDESVKLSKMFCDKKWPVLAFLDTHQPGKLEHPYPSHCLAGSDESNLVPGTYIHSLASLICQPLYCTINYIDTDIDIDETRFCLCI